MVMGTILDYCILPGSATTPEKIALLFIGVALGFTAILTLAYADSRREPEHIPAPDTISTPAVSALHLPPGSDGLDSPSRVMVPFHISLALESEESEVHIDAPAQEQSAVPNRRWIYVTLVAGLIASTWSPLSNLGAKNAFEPC
jgi:hypothetical protein